VDRGAVVQLGIRNQTQKVQVAARVAWVKRTSWKTYEIGFQFIEVKPQVAAVLVNLARYGFVAADRSTTGASTQAAPPPNNVRVALEVEDLYGALGIVPDASQDDVQAAYRKLARTHHPDVSDDPDAEAKFAFISKAYSVLRDPVKRKRYDSLLELSRAGSRQEAA
jgi:DnaJ-domain-containing protein 1